jgi:uncharacterized protein (TIGR03790 family)
MRNRLSVRSLLAAASVSGAIGSFPDTANASPTQTPAPTPVISSGVPDFVTYPPGYVHTTLGLPFSLSASAVDSDATASVTYWWSINKGALLNASFTNNGGTFTTPVLTTENLAKYTGAYTLRGYVTRGGKKFTITGWPIVVDANPAGTATITGLTGRYTYTAGETLNLKAMSQTPAARFTWQINGALVANATTDTLTIRNVRPGTMKIAAISHNGKLTNEFDATIKVLPSTTSPLTANDLALLINDKDPYSVKVGAYYQKARRIPSSNVIHLNFSPNTVFDRNDFSAFRSRVMEKIPNNVQVIAIGWAAPYKVECNSLTSALSRGLDAQACAGSTRQEADASTCGFGTLGPNPLLDSNSNKPFTTAGFRPSMMLAAYSVADAKAMIDHGVASDGTRPQSSAYVLATSDQNRRVRALKMAGDPSAPWGVRDSRYVNTQLLVSDGIKGKNDVMFYETGIAGVPNLGANKFLPGAVGDHLTSYGGLHKQGNGQTGVLDWIKSGATGSFGTVSEPCAHLEKFPNPRLLIQHYGHGDTLIEAYWKSVAITFQGLFIGEPLASPYK